MIFGNNIFYYFHAFYFITSWSFGLKKSISSLIYWLPFYLSRLSWNMYLTKWFDFCLVKPILNNWFWKKLRYFSFDPFTSSSCKENCENFYSFIYSAIQYPLNHSYFRYIIRDVFFKLIIVPYSTIESIHF